MVRALFRTRYTPIAIWILFVLSVVIYYFADNKTGFYQILVVSMYFSPFLFLFCVKGIEGTDVLLIISLLTMFVNGIWHPEFFRASTVLYSGMFVSTFLLYKNLIYRKALTINLYTAFVKFIIFAYFVVLIIQQIQVFLHLPVFNQCWIFEGDSYKLNSLSMEPSNTLLIIPLFLFSYIKMMEILRNEEKYLLQHCYKEDKWIWVAAMYVCFTSGSTSVFFTVPFLMCYFLSEKNLSYIFLLPFIIVIGIVLLSVYKNELLNRFIDVSTGLLMINEGGIKSIDGSSACRIIPIVEFFRTIELSPDLIFGHGVDRMEIHNTILIVGDPERKIGAKNILAQFYDYGWISGICFMIFLFKTIAPKLFSFESFFYIAAFTIITLNHYVLWLFICLMFTNQFFEKKYYEYKKVFCPHHNI